MGTVIGLNRPEEMFTLFMLNGSIHHMEEKNRELLNNGGNPRYVGALEKEKKLRKKYLKKLVA